MSDTYLDVFNEFIRLVVASGLPMPSVSPELAGDQCDVTDAHEVRLNATACSNCEDHSPQEHARHVFGHWLCDLHHSDEPYEGISDMVADYIADLLTPAHSG